MNLRGLTLTIVFSLWSAKEALAHVSEQGFVLLLPTAAYSAAGVAVVALTVIVLFVVPPGTIERLFRHKHIRGFYGDTARMVTSLVSLILLAGLVYVGVDGPRDPLSNLMPLVFWTIGWVGLVTISGLVGDLWRWINPWSGLYRFIGRMRPPLALPATLGVWPAVVLLVGFAAFLLADIAPDDPTRLAYLVGIYWLITMSGLILCGSAWLSQVELGSAIFSSYAKLAPLRLRREGGIGCPGWRLLDQSAIPGGGAFALTLLAVGSFDGLNETFLWLAHIGVNPLAFPGRSAVVWPTLLGLIASIAGLFAAFAITVWLGLTLAKEKVDFRGAFCRLALTLLPIALAYHFAHYLTVFLVNIQHTLAAMSDPLGTGADVLGLQPFYVTTGFFNHIETVRVIWLAQAGAVVIGHVWSVLLAHRMALALFSDHRRAVLATLPLSAFMIGYTALGLWLLSTPKGA